jgi:protein-disulfide isomerase
MNLNHAPSARSVHLLRTTALACVAMLLSSVSFAQTPNPGAKVDRAAIEQIVRDYLLSNPEIIEQASAALRVKQAEAQERATQAALKTQHAALYQHAATPVMGNSAGDVVIVEFFDYRCGYCKRVAPAVNALVKNDSNVKVVLKELPILGPESVFAARAALAAHKQGKYAEMHLGLLAADAIDEKSVLAVATRVGLDVERLQRDAKDESISKQLAENQALADALAVNGTPAFIVGNRMLPGALDEAGLATIVSAERALAKAGNTAPANK